MRRWGRVPICKAFRPNHELGIHTHATLLRKERKEVIQGIETDLKSSRVERTIWRREEIMFSTMEGREKKRSNLILDVRSHRKDLSTS
jgi:hypothetical protein